VPFKKPKAPVHPPLEITYRLPVTSVVFTGEVTETRDDLMSPPNHVVSRVAAVVAGIGADPRAERTLVLPRDDVDKLKVTLGLLEDGRLTGTSSTIDERRADRVLAIAKLAVTGGAAGLALGGPAGLAIGAVGAGLLGGAHAFSVNALGAAVEAPEDELAGGGGPGTEEGATSLAEPDLDPDALGIDARYKEMGGDYERLARYRVALIRLALMHATVAEGVALDTSMMGELLRLDRALEVTRREAAFAEAAYAGWLRSKRTVTTTKHEFQLFIDELPTEARLKREVSEGAAKHADVKRWWDVVEALGVMVTCDADPPIDPPESEEKTTQPDQAAVEDKPAATASAEALAYRPLRIARLVTWRLADPDRGGRWTAAVEGVERLWVAHPLATTELHVPFTSDSDMSVSVGFAESGALTSVSSDQSGRLGDRAQLMAQFAGDAAAAAKSGSELADAFSPSVARAAALKRELEEAENQQKLSGILSPTPVNPTSLSARVAEAELQARLAIADHLSKDPTTSVVFVRQQQSG
jgi:hypothetical protein